MAAVFLDEAFTVNSPLTTVTADEVFFWRIIRKPIISANIGHHDVGVGLLFAVWQIVSTYTYQSVHVEGTVVTPRADTYTFKTSKHVPKTRMMLVGWGGNNGSTVLMHV